MRTCGMVVRVDACLRAARALYAHLDACVSASNLFIACLIALDSIGCARGIMRDGSKVKSSIIRSESRPRIFIGIHRKVMERADEFHSESEDVGRFSRIHRKGMESADGFHSESRWV